MRWFGRLKFCGARLDKGSVNAINKCFASSGIVHITNMVFWVFIVTASAAQCVFNVFGCCCKPIQAQCSDEVAFSASGELAHLEESIVDAQPVIPDEDSLRFTVLTQTSAQKPQKAHIAERELDEILFVPAESNNTDVSSGRLSEFSHATTASSLVGFTYSSGQCVA